MREETNPVETKWKGRVQGTGGVHLRAEGKSRHGGQEEAKAHTFGSLWEDPTLPRTQEASGRGGSSRYLGYN